jgi:hypothetical protein
MTKCPHSGLKKRRFKDGKVIRLCPSWTSFDEHGREVLNPVSTQRRQS